MKNNVFPLISSCRETTHSWRRLQEVHRNSYEIVCDNIQDCKRREEPYSLEDPFGEPYGNSYEEPCMFLVMVDMYYEGIHGDGESFLEEDDVKVPILRPFATLIAKSHVDELLLVEKTTEREACCEILILGGMYYDNGMDDELFPLEEKYDENKKCIDEPIMWMECF